MYMGKLYKCIHTLLRVHACATPYKGSTACMQFDYMSSQLMNLIYKLLSHANLVGRIEALMVYYLNGACSNREYDVFN